jgi:hypothetical protein
LSCHDAAKRPEEEVDTAFLRYFCVPLLGDAQLQDGLRISRAARRQKRSKCCEMCNFPAILPKPGAAWEVFVLWNMDAAAEKSIRVDQLHRPAKLLNKRRDRSRAGCPETLR